MVVLAGPLFGSGWATYWTSVLLIGLAFIALFLTLARWSGTAHKQRLRAAALFSIP